jgi:regulator of protease activity HflC (stomatin/prohibitin superfamily)
MYRSMAVAVIAVVSLLLIMMVGCAGCTTIGPGYVGIQINKTGASRGVQDVTIRTGRVWVNPWTQEVIEYPTYIQTVKWTASKDEGKPQDESITFTTGNGMIVNADVSMSYQLGYDQAPAFYVKFRADKIDAFTDGFLRNVTRDSFNNIAGHHQITDIMGNNGPILIDIRKDVQAQLTPYGITISQLGFIGAPRPPQSVIDSINLKAQAEQIALTKQIELTQVEADAKKAVAEADGQAAANIALAKSDAEANKLRTESLTPALLEYNAIQKWDGHRPQVEGSGAGVLVSIPKP